MKFFFDPDLIARTYRDPLAVASLVVDLLPIVAVLVFGWGATPLVALYWLENLVIGLFTVLRIVATGFANVANVFGAIFMVPFFTVHYGMFCYGHGVFLRAFAMDGGVGSPGVGDLISWALGSGQGMAYFVLAILIMNGVFYVSDFLIRGEFRKANLATEMFSPYGRIVTLHVAIILGALLAFGSDEPLFGVLLLILMRVVFGIALSAYRQHRRDREIGAGMDELGSTV
ncbi:MULTISPECIES: DUF6498-containing protein [Hyphomonas]|uniref:DUF6498-containing protein n=1 Tax=Hyphomonas TaxID=85 RepID=UPI000EEF6730|nr:hypothetical protein [Hyphomonas sp.]